VTDHSTLSEAARKRVESFVDDCAVEGNLPGVSLAVVSADDGLRYANGFGARNLERNRPMTADTLFGIGSVTKSFTTLAVMQLVEDGALAVDDPVSDYLSVYDDAPGEPMTVHELMCHGSGMPSDASAVALIRRYAGLDGDPVPLSDADDFDRHVESSVDDRVLDREEPFFYYNSGYTVLGRLIEAVSGRPYREYVGERVLDPLGMERTTFDREAVADDDDALTGYVTDDDGQTEAAFPHDPVVDAPGGLLSSVRELAPYLRMQMNGGGLDGERLLGEDLVESMHAPYRTRETRLDGTEQEYGYGWMSREFLGDRLVGHGGTITVSTGYVGFLKDAGLGVAVGCNTASDVHPMDIGPAVLAILSGEAPESVAFFGLRSKVEAVAGTYESHRGVVEARVERAGGGARLSLSDREFSLHPTSADPGDLTFETVTAAGNREPVEFRRTDDGMELYVKRWRLRRTGAP
jgi:CubicO group peptidase (beta-lactamase class C family)